MNGRFSKFFSTYLDLVRVIAASIVVLGHYPISNWQAKITTSINTGYDAVVIFFVLSGYVVTYAAENIDKEWKAYALSRIIRIYPVTIAAISLSLIVLYYGVDRRPEIFHGTDQIQNIPLFYWMSATFANEFWWQSVSSFGNGPFWTLVFEVWCYVIYGIVYFARGNTRIILLAIVLCITGPKQWILFLIWFSGSAAYKFRDVFNPGRTALWVMLVAPLAIYISIQIVMPYDWSYGYVGKHVEALFGHGLDGAANFGAGYILAACFCSHLIAVEKLSRLKEIILSTKIDSAIKVLAGYTFSLYIIHVPIIHFLMVVYGRESDGINIWRAWIYVQMLIAVVIFAKIFEHNKNMYKKYVLKAFIK